jgi:dihydrofolate reductase
MRLVKYRVATSVDGFIAGPNGEIDWIIPDPSVDFTAIYAQFDTVLLGRHTYELTLQPGAPPWPEGWRIYVFSRSLNPADHPTVTVVNAGAEATVARLREESGRDIWLFGGGHLFGTLLAAKLVDEIELAVMPVLLAKGIPLTGPDAIRAQLGLVRVVEGANGILHVRYEPQRRPSAR